MAIEIPPAPPRDRPPTPPKVPPRRTDSDDGGISRRGFLKKAGIAASALAIGGGGTYLLTRSDQAPEPKVTQSSQPTETSVVQPTTPTTPETTTPEVASTPIEQMQQRVVDFLNPNEFTRDELNQWVYEKDTNGLDNVFSYVGTPFAYPYWSENTVVSTHNNTLEYTPSGKSIPMEPHFSFLNFIPERSYASMLMFNLGSVKVPLKDSSSNAHVTVGFFGGILPESLGGERFVSPFIININDPANPTPTILGDIPFIASSGTKNDLDDARNKMLTGTMNRQEFLTQMNDTVGHPMVISLSSTESGGYRPGDIIPGIDYVNSEHRGFYLNGGLSLLKGGPEEFDKALASYASAGHINTAGNTQIPDVVKNGFDSKEAAFAFAPLGLIEFIDGSVAAPIIK